MLYKIASLIAIIGMYGYIGRSCVLWYRKQIDSNSKKKGDS